MFQASPARKIGEGGPVTPSRPHQELVRIPAELIMMGTFEQERRGYLSYPEKADHRSAIRP
jgi:hypothetical protein